MASGTEDHPRLITGCIICRKQDELKQCAQCRVVHFCGQAHQREYWSQHKVVCKKIGKLRKELEQKQKGGRDVMTAVLGGIAAESLMGRKAGGVHPREQLRLAEQELEINTRAVVESALDHVIDMRNMPFSSNRDVLEIASSCLIRLGRDQEAYNYLKHWLSRHRGDYDMLESPDVFTGKTPTATFLANVYVLKMRLQMGFSIAAQEKATNGIVLDQTATDSLRYHVICSIDKKLHERNGSNVTIQELAKQIEELRMKVEELDPGFWTKLKTAHRDRGTRQDSSGLESYPILHTYRAFMETGPDTKLIESITAKIDPQQRKEADEWFASHGMTSVQDAAQRGMDIAAQKAMDNAAEKD